MNAIYILTMSFIWHNNIRSTSGRSYDLVLFCAFKLWKVIALPTKEEYGDVQTTAVRGRKWCRISCLIYWSDHGFRHHRSGPVYRPRTVQWRRHRNGINCRQKGSGWLRRGCCSSTVLHAYKRLRKVDWGAYCGSFRQFMLWNFRNTKTL